MPRRKRPVLGVDYIMDSDGRAQFTREYLLKRGYCCNQECRYCPFIQEASVDCQSASHGSTTESAKHASGHSLQTVLG